jgi:formate dehydrogenase
MALFRSLLDHPNGVIFARAEWTEVLATFLEKPIELALEDLLLEIGRLKVPASPDPDFPFVLSAGERRSFTANTIIRDPAWRKKDSQGALRMNPDDGTRLGVSTGQKVRLTTKRGSALVLVELSQSMQVGHISLPNGLGLARAGDENPGAESVGVAPNELTSAAHRDPWAGTPLHKHVPARVEALDPSPSPQRGLIQ